MRSGAAAQKFRAIISAVEPNRTVRALAYCDKIEEIKSDE